LCYIYFMALAPISLRLDKDIHSLLAEGGRRTPLKKQELIRRTLRNYLPRVIEQESSKPRTRVTNVAPLPRGAMASAYRRLTRIDKGWERVEEAAIKAQGHPSWED
jgi:hypothetical protein